MESFFLLASVVPGSRDAEDDVEGTCASPAPSSGDGRVAIAARSARARERFSGFWWRLHTSGRLSAVVVLSSDGTVRARTRGRAAMARTAAMTNVHGAVADVPTDLASLLDVGGKPHAADVVSAPSLADALGTSSDAARGRTPAFEGRWFLKRSEHIRRWIRTWIALDASGTMLEMKNDALDVKPRAVVRVRDVRCVPAASRFD